MEHLSETSCELEQMKQENELEVISLGEATQLTKGDWGMWPEITGEMARE